MVENADLHKPVLNKIKTTNEWCLKYDFLAPLMKLNCLWEAAIQENLRNTVAIRSSHQDAFFNIAVRHLWRNSLKNYCDGVWFFVNLHVTFSNFEQLLQKFKYIYIFSITFSFTYTDDSQDSKGMEGTIFYSTLPLPPAHEHWDIYLQLCIWDDYHVFLIAMLVFTRLLLDEFYHITELPFDWLFDDAMFVCLLDESIRGFSYSDLTWGTGGFGLAHRLSPLY